MDYYQILGVARNATDSEIKTAYRKLAFESHPDRNPGDKTAAEKFKQIQAAYETLIDVNLRARYNGNSYSPPPRRPHPQTKPKPKPQPPKKSTFEFRQYGRDFKISDAPPPRVDLWGNPLSEEEKAAWVRNNVTHVIKTDKQMQKIMDGWRDSYAGHYESSGSPDIR